MIQRGTKLTSIYKEIILKAKSDYWRQKFHKDFICLPYVKGIPDGIDKTLPNEGFMAVFKPYNQGKI